MFQWKFANNQRCVSLSLFLSYTVPMLDLPTLSNKCYSFMKLSLVSLASSDLYFFQIHRILIDLSGLSHPSQSFYLRSLLNRFTWRRTWQPTPVFLLENPMDTGAWWAVVHGVTKSQTTHICIYIYTHIYIDTYIYIHTHTHQHVYITVLHLLNHLKIAIAIMFAMI